MRAALCFEQMLAVWLVIAACGNYWFVDRHVLPVVDVACACGLVVCFHHLRAAGNRVPIRVGLALLVARWVDSCGWLATQRALPPFARFGAIAGQTVVFTCTLARFWPR